MAQALISVGIAGLDAEFALGGAGTAAAPVPDVDAALVVGYAVNMNIVEDVEVVAAGFVVAELGDFVELGAGGGVVEHGGDADELSKVFVAAVEPGVEP